MKPFVIIVLVAATLVISVRVWMSVNGASPDMQAGVGAASARQEKFDTTGGQEMRPRWSRQEGEGDGAADN